MSSRRISTPWRLWAVAAMAVGVFGAWTMAQVAREPAGGRLAAAPAVVLQWRSMVGVDGPLLGDTNPIRGIAGGGAPWAIRSGRGLLLADGTLQVEVRGLVIPTPPQNGTNPAPFFRATVSCMTVDDLGNLAEENVSTAPDSTTMLGDPANGDAVLRERLTLPSPCLGPMVFVTSPTGSWFALNGAGTIQAQ